MSFQALASVLPPDPKFIVEISPSGKLSGSSPAARIENGFLSVLEACAFEDLIGQRLAQLQGAVAADGLENGPARHGQGLDQAAADDLFDA